MRGWEYRTRKGTCRIIRRPDGSFEVMYGDEGLGSYHSPQQALDDLVGGHTFSPSSGIDTSTMGLPDELSEWTIIP